MNSNTKTRKIKKTSKKIVLKPDSMSIEKSKKTLLNTPIFKDRDTIDVCKEEKETKEKLNKTRKKIREKKEMCENELYKYIFSFFTKNETLEDLLESLYNFYNHKKSKDNAFRLSFSDFIYMFPRDTTQKGFNFKRQHVFEQICRILLLLNYDKNYFGHKKVFYNSLEEFAKGYDKELTKTEILNSKINDGSAAQSVDIFFKIPNNKVKKLIHKNACENNYSITDDKNSKKDLYILIQNKFYDKEYSSADKYDVTKIAHRAKELSSERFDSSQYKIILMVNNKQLLDTKIKRNRNDDFGLVSEIFGLQELEQWFQNMLFDMYKSISFKNFIQNDKINKQESLQLRFHQDLIVNTTHKFITHNDTETKRKKFIWGCVPRSGKSYMIAGMIAKTDLFLKSSNNKLIILGAKTETEGQFIEMFKEYDTFNDYGIITSKSDIKKAKENGKTKFIFILSQEKIKVNKNNNEFKDKFKEDFEDFEDLLKSKNIDLYFDEIHKGGSTENAQDKIIHSLLGEGIDIDLFVMVTATYARPSIAYETLVTKEPPVILNWSYIDQQNMKQITNETVLENFKQNRNNDIEREVIDELLHEYEGKYGKDYLFTLEEFYKKYPELVIIQPFIDSKQEPFDLHGNVFKLKCSAIGKTIEELSNPSNIFENNSSVLQLLNFIGKSEHDLLEPNTIYGKLKHKYNYDVINTRHSQLWFLPYSNLYTNPEDCKFSKKLTAIKTGYEKDQRDYSDESSGLPNIEPLTRGLVLNMLSIPFYKKHFCFLVVHGQKIYDYYGKNVDNTLIYTRENCVKYSETEKRKSVKDIITNYEDKTYRLGKSLIILTGSMLRLGVSLPCVDIGLNFDNIMSIDLNYQTMFRVLTERKNKSYGYYLDFFPNRSIQFLYQFNEIYGSGFKNTDNMDDMVIQLQSLLYLFNYNGLSISRIDEKQTLELYNTLISNLELTKENYSQHYVKGGIQTIKSLLLSLGNKELIDELSKIKFDVKVDKTKKQTKQVVKDGKKREVALLKDEIDEEDKIQDEDDEIQEDKEIADINTLSDILYTFTSILALFSSEKDYNCFNLKDCVTKIINNLNEIHDLKNFCDCNSESIDVLGCYMKRISEYDIEQYKKSLKIFESIIENKTSKYEVIKNSLFIIFDNIKRHIGMKDKLIYNMSSKDIQEKIEEYLPVREIEKDKYGEVFTPASLINEMLDKLPKSVWKNPDLKWLDPANGSGNFPMIAFEKLNEGLKNVDGYKDETKRKKHIIKNMLYMVELNEKNVGISKKVFGKDANIYCGSFLEDEWYKHFGVEKFDVIMGNPPFNKEQDGKRKGGYGGRTLWDKFVLNSLKVLKKNGFLTFIHPANWRGLGELSKLWDIMSKKQLLYLHIFSKKDGKTYFNIGSRFDIYVLQNKVNIKPTEVIDETGNKNLLQLNKLPFLPNYAYNEINKILTTEDKGIDVIYSRSLYGTDKTNMKEIKTGEYKYPVVHSITQEGITYWYSNTNTKGHFGVPKVILNFNEHQYSYPEQNDYKGKYGMSQISFGIPIKSKKEGGLILKAFERPEFKKIIAATKWGAFQTDYRMFKYFKPDFYKYFLDGKTKTPKSKKTKKRTKHLSSSKERSNNTKTIKNQRRHSVGGHRLKHKH